MWTSFTREEKKFLGILLLFLGVGLGYQHFASRPRQVPLSVYATNAQTPAPGRPTPASKGTAASASADKAADARLDLNTATVEQFEALPGIGPSKAQAIVAWRAEHGAFSSVDQLDEVNGFGPATVARLRPWLRVADAHTTGTAPQGRVVTEALRPTPAKVSAARSSAFTAGSPAITTATAASKPATPDAGLAPVRVNTATQAELESLAHVGPALAKRILEHRAARGPFRSMEDFDAVPGIGPKIVEANRTRLVFQ